MQVVEGERIEVVDSGFWSGALALIVLEAAEAASSGKGLEAVLSVAEDAKTRAGLVAMADTLEYAAKGGRIGKAQYYLGSLLQIKPILQIKDGELHPVERPRTRRKAMRRLVELVREHKRLDRLAITHALSGENAQQLADELRPLTAGQEVLISPIGPVIGTHTGPGALGIGYLAPTR
jgi:DegV family protein with EDD domain